MNNPVSLRYLCLAVALLFLWGCTAAPYKTEIDARKNIDFTAFKTFSWQQPTLVHTGDQPKNPLFEVRLKAAAKVSLERAGYRFVDSAESADLIVAFSIGSRDKIRVDSYPESYRGPYTWGGAYYGSFGRGYNIGMSTSTEVRQYTEGTLAMDLFDAKLKQPVWHGSARGVLKDRTSEEKALLLQQLLDDLVGQIVVAPPTVVAL